MVVVRWRLGVGLWVRVGMDIVWYCIISTSSDPHYSRSSCTPTPSRRPHHRQPQPPHAQQHERVAEPDGARHSVGGKVRDVVVVDGEDDVLREDAGAVGWGTGRDSEDARRAVPSQRDAEAGLAPTQLYLE
jgi:hypothetical protein